MCLQEEYSRLLYRSVPGKLAPSLYLCKLHNDGRILNGAPAAIAGQVQALLSNLIARPNHAAIDGD